jgi:hypothetical protein
MALRELLLGTDVEIDRIRMVLQRFVRLRRFNLIYRRHSGKAPFSIAH